MSKIDVKICGYLKKFTTIFPRLLIHCYKSAETVAKNLFENYFCKKEVSNEKSEADDKSHGIVLKGSTLRVEFNRDVKFSETSLEFDSLLLDHISHLSVLTNKSFFNFLHKNGSKVTELMLSNGTIKFDSLNTILKKLPDLKKIKSFHLKASTR